MSGGGTERGFELALERLADLAQDGGGADEAFDHVVIAGLRLAQVQVPGALEEVLSHLDAPADPLERFATATVSLTDPEPLATHRHTGHRGLRHLLALPALPTGLAGLIHGPFIFGPDAIHLPYLAFADGSDSC